MTIDTLVRDYGPRLERLCARVAGEPDLAKDAYQESLLQMHRALPRFDGRSSLYTWAFRIALNVSLNAVRGNQRRNARLGEPSRPLQSSDDPDVSCVRTFRARIVEEALRRLPAAHRVALTLHDLEEMPATEVAAALAITPVAVRQRVSRARRALRAMIAEEFGRRRLAVDGIEDVACVSGLFAETTDNGFAASAS